MDLPEFQIGRHLFLGGSTSVELNMIIPTRRSAPEDSIKGNSYDDRLHQSIDKIFRERCHGSSEKFKEFLRGPQHNTDYNSIIEPILESEPFLSVNFSKEELGKLSLLWIAVLCCYEKSAELLVRCGADVNELFGRHYPQVIAKKSTVLHVLLQMNPTPENEQLIRLIVDHGADLKARDGMGQTILYYAMKVSRIQVTEVLLEKGANVNVVDLMGRTPLLAAVRFSRKANELVSLLMRHGVDVFFKTRNGENVLHILALAPAGNLVDLAKVFIEKGVSLDDKTNREHCQPIHFAAQFGMNKLVKLYLDHGANVNALAKNGESPLTFAVQCYSNNSRSVAKTLLKRGANIHMRTRRGRTALHTACKSAVLFSEAKQESMIRLLLSAGADLLAEDRKGKTPFALISSSRRSVKRPGTWLVIKALALRKALQPSIELKDEAIIERHPMFRDYYRKCTDEMDRLKSTRIVGTCTFFQLLANCRCQIAELMRNPDFESKFKLYDLKEEFSICAENLIRAFERAHKYYREVQEMEYMINEAVYEILPYMIVKKVVHFIFNCCGNVSD